MLGGINQRRAHRDDISRFYSIANKKIMRKCPNSFKINYEDHLTESKENEDEYEDRYEDDGCVGEVKLLVEPFQAEVFTYSRDFLDLKLKSSHLIDFWIVPSREDVDKLLEGKDFDYNSKLSKEKTKEHSVSDYVSPGS